MGGGGLDDFPKAPESRLVSGEHAQVGHGGVWSWEVWEGGELVEAGSASPAAGVIVVPEEVLTLGAGSPATFEYGGTKPPIGLYVQASEIEPGEARYLGEDDGRGLLIVSPARSWPRKVSDIPLPARLSGDAAEIIVADLPAGEYAMDVSVQGGDHESTSYGFHVAVE